jgi:hypothetical protein
VAQFAGAQPADEDDLQSEVEDRCDDQRSQDRPRNITSRIRALTADLNRLLEADERKDDASYAESRDHTMRSGREEATRNRVKVSDTEAGADDDDRQDKRDDLPNRNRSVEPGYLSDAPEIEEREQDDKKGRHRDAWKGKRHGAVGRVSQPGHIVACVLQHGLDLDRHSRDPCEPGGPSDRKSCEASESVMRKAGRAAADCKHAAEFGKHERKHGNGGSADDPRQHHRRPRDLRCEQRTEQPSRSDDRPYGYPDELDAGDVTTQPTSGSGGGRLRQIFCGQLCLLINVKASRSDRKHWGSVPPRRAPQGDSSPVHAGWRPSYGFGSFKLRRITSCLSSTHI